MTELKQALHIKTDHLRLDSLTRKSILVPLSAQFNIVHQQRQQVFRVTDMKTGN